MTAPGGVIATVYVQVLPRVQSFAKQLRADLRKSQRDLRAIDRELKPVEEGFRRIGAVATGIVPGVRLVRTALLAVGGKAVLGGLLSAAGAMTTMSGALLTLPAAGAAAASVMGTLAIGLRGVGDTLKDFDDVEDFNEGLAELSENARATIGVLNEFRGEIDAFRDSVQDRLFAGLDQEFGGLIEDLLPRFETHFGNIADTVNAGAKDLVGFVRSAETLADVDEIMANTELSVVALRGALVPAAQAFRDVGVVGSRVLPEVAGEVTELVRKFADFIAVARATGQLEQWIRTAVEQLKQLARIAFNVGRAFVALTGAAQEAGAGLLSTLESLTDRLATFLESARGQDSIREFLGSAKDAAEDVLPVLGALADLFFLHVMPVFAEVANVAGPAVTDFFYALGDALDIARPGITAFAAGFASFIRAIIPALPVIAQLVAQIGQFIGVLATEAGPAVASIITALGNILIPVFQALTAVVDALGPSFLKIIAVIGTTIVVLGVLTTVVRGVLTVTSLFAGGLNLLTEGASKTQGPLRSVTSFLGGPWGIVLGAATLALGLFLSATEGASEQQQQFKQSAQELNDVIREQNGIINENVRIKAAEQLEQSGALQLAKELGISTRDVTDAYLGQGDALKQVRDQLQGNIAALTAEQDKFKSVRGGRARAQEIQAEIDANQRLLGIINGLVGERNADSDATNRQAEAATNATGAMGLYRNMVDSVRVANELLRQEQQRQQDVQLAATNSNLAYQNSLARTTAELADGVKTLDIGNAEGRENLGVLTELAAAGQRRVADLKAQKASTDVVNAAIKQNEDAILGLIQPFFNSAEAARKYAEDVGLIPKAPTVTPKFNDGEARARAANFNAYLDYVARDRVATIRFNSRGNAQAAAGIPTGGFDIATNATGGFLPAGRWSWVGEKGPELVRFTRSARVFSNQESLDMARDVGTLDSMTSYGGSGVTGRSPGGVGGGNGKLEASITVETKPEVHVYVDGKEVRAIVRTELDENNRRLVRLVEIGTGRRL